MNRQFGNAVLGSIAFATIMIFNGMLIMCISIYRSIVFTIKPRFSISARIEADQEVEDVREKAKIVRKA